MEEEDGLNCKKVKIILASGSPRRERIFQQLRIDFEVFNPAETEEKIFKSPYKTVIYNSIAKAQFVYNNVIIKNLNYRNVLIAGFDTIIYMNGEYFGKPGNIEQAEKYLKKLSGRNHLVITGIAIIDEETKVMVTGSDKTVVKFRKLSCSQIKSYLKDENVLDKAGAYDISGYGSILVEKINGCFYNVAGLPVYRFIRLLDRLNKKILY